MTKYLMGGFLLGILFSLVVFGVAMKNIVSNGVTVTVESSMISQELGKEVKARLSEIVNSQLDGARKRLSERIANHISDQLGELPAKIPGFKLGLQTLVEGQVNEVLDEKTLTKEIETASGPFTERLADLVRERIDGSKYSVTIFGRYNVPVTVLVH